MTVERAPAGAAPALERALASFRSRAEQDGLVDVALARIDSPVGPLTLAGTPQGLLRVVFSGEEDDAVDDLARRVSPRILEAPQRLEPVRRELEQYFSGSLRSFSLRLDWTLVGPFGRRVLQRALQIPYGAVATYREIARDIGAPLAARAVGNALGANPIPVVVPCHRVVRTGGALGGYGGGIDRKERLLHLEGAQGWVTSRAGARSG